METRAWLLISAFVLVLSACGDKLYDSVLSGPSTCTVVPAEGGSTIRCPDGTSAFVPNGARGPQGAAGAGCSIQEVEGGAKVSCANGSTAFIANGKTGATGATGASGTSCQVSSVTGGARISCSDGTSAFVADGADGTDGRNGSSCAAIADLNGGTVACSDGTSFFLSNGVNATPLTPVKFCADDHSSFPEYGFRLGEDIYAVYYDPAKGAFWAKLLPGRYTSTNGSGCQFTLNPDGTITP